MPSLQRPFVHLITPGDHFSPRTGSAIPTVVDGLSRAAQSGSPRSRVLVARGTYSDRYDSADVLEYDLPEVPRWGRYIDAVRGRIGLRRVFTSTAFAAALEGQEGWAPAVVFAHNAVPAVPLVKSQHAAVLFAHNALLRTYTTTEVDRTLGEATGIICVSDALAEQTAASLPARLRDRLRVVRNGVDCRLFHPESASRDTGELRVIFVGRMIPDKGADVLLDAVRQLGRDDVTVSLVGSAGFAADAPLTRYEEELRTRAEPLGDRVRFVRFTPRSELPALLRSADVLVCPSRWPEPFGLTVLEGMASGLAVVASEIGGIPEAMGRAGIRVPPEDPARLAEVIEVLATDDDLRTSVAADCRRHAESCEWRFARERLDEAVESLI